jgi:acetylornithine deacetylase/succinyl-diaminopimelate desuccinylase family protein
MADWERSKSAVLSMLQDVVGIDSVNPALPGGSGGEGGMADYIEQFFTALEIPCHRREILPGRPNILATLEGQDPTRMLLFECHMDTASTEIMTTPPFEPHIRDGLLYGRGSCDTKAGGVAMMMAMKQLKEANITPPLSVVYAGVMDEEHLMRGSQALAVDLWPEAMVVAEPTDLEVICAHKGVVRFNLTVRGKAAHSSKPYLGVNAISHMARLLTQLETGLEKSYRQRQHPLIGHPTYSVGTITGGSQVNFVPDHCSVAIDCRTIPGDSSASTLAEFQAIVDAAAAEDPQLEAQVAAPYFQCSPVGTAADAAIVETALAACRSALGTGKTGGVPFATDGSAFSEKQVATIILGPGSIDQAHAAVEWVECAQVENAVEVYRGIMERGI